MVAINVIYRCFNKSFCNKWVDFKLKSRVPLRNCLRGHSSSKVVKLPIMAFGAQNMEYVNSP